MSSLMWCERMHSDLVVVGLAEQTREACLRAVRLLSPYDNDSSPTQLTEQQFKVELQENRPTLQFSCVFA